MTDTLIVALSALLLAGLAATLVIRTALAERSAGTGSRRAPPFVPPALVRRLDVTATALAVLVVATCILRVVLGTTGISP
jgi:hypothetical protein